MDLTRYRMRRDKNDRIYLLLLRSSLVSNLITSSVPFQTNSVISLSLSNFFVLTLSQNSPSSHLNRDIMLRHSENVLTTASQNADLTTPSDKKRKVCYFKIYLEKRSNISQRGGRTPPPPPPSDDGTYCDSAVLKIFSKYPQIILNLLLAVQPHPPRPPVSLKISSEYLKDILTCFRRQASCRRPPRTPCGCANSWSVQDILKRF